MGVRAVTTTLVALGAAALVAGVAVSWAGGAKAAGDPDRGALVYVSSGCGACHVFRQAGSTGTSGPDLDRWLATHANRARLPAGTFALSRIAWGGRGMPPYAGQLSPAEMDDLAAFLVGATVTAPPGDIPFLQPFPAVPPLASVPAATVRAWTTAKRLTGSARRGATVFAKEGCLSCHRYLGAGTRRFGAPDLGDGGPSRATAARLRRQIASPAALGSTLMPGYADLGEASIRALADFLVASRARPSVR